MLFVISNSSTATSGHMDAAVGAAVRLNVVVPKLRPQDLDHNLVSNDSKRGFL